MAAVASEQARPRLLWGAKVRLSDGTEATYIGWLGNGQHQVETAQGETRIVSREMIVSDRSERGE